MGDQPSGVYVSERPTVPIGSDAKAVEQGKQYAGTAPVKVDVNRLRSDISTWHEQSSTWTGITGKIAGLPLKDSYSLIAPYTTGYNGATAKLTNFTAAAPEQMEKTSTNVRDAADSYDRVDHDNAQSVKNTVEVKDGASEYSRFSPSGTSTTKPSAALDDKIKNFNKEMEGWAKTAPDSSKALDESLKRLQLTSGSEIDLNPLDGEVGGKAGDGVSGEAGKMGAEYKLAFALIKKAMSGSGNWGGGDVAGKIEGTLGANAKGEIVVKPGEIEAKLGGFAGAEATAEGTFANGIPGVTVKGKVGATAGVGAEGGGKFGFEDGKLHISADGKISPLLGVKAGAELTIDSTKFFGHTADVITEKRWTTTGEEIEKQGQALEALGCGPIHYAIEAMANSESAKKWQLEGAVRQAGDTFLNAFLAFNNTYKIVSAGKDFPSRSDSAIGGWDTVARDSGNSSNSMAKVRSTSYWMGTAASMYDNLAARHANAAYDVSVASSFMCESLAKVGRAMNTLFGVAIATGKTAEAKANDVIRKSKYSPGASDSSKENSAAALFIRQLQSSEPEVKKTTSTLAVAVSAFEQLAAQLGGLVSSVGESVGSDSGGGWPAA